MHELLQERRDTNERDRVSCQGSKLVEGAKSAIANVRSHATTIDGHFDQVLLESRVVFERGFVS